MRATYLALRLLTAGCLLTSVAGCAQGGIDDDELNNVGEGDDDDSPRGDAGSRRDAGRDARASSGEDDEDDEPSVSTNRDAGGTSGSKDAGGTGGGTGGSKDAGSTPGGGTGGAKIKCPSPMVCDTTLSTFLSLIDMSISAGDSLCASTGGIVPMAVSCTTVDTCKSARLTTAVCSGGSCIQPCTP